MADKGKHTRVSRALERSASAPAIEMPIVQAPTWVPRLSFRYGSRLPAAESNLVRSLSTADAAALFFDASILTRKIDVPLWTELLRCPGRLFMIERVWQELKPHFAKVPSHPLADAIRSKNPALVLHQEPDEGPRADALLYYVNLLATRRKQLDRLVQRYTREHGREPDDEAMIKIEAQYQRDFGERGVLMARKRLSPIFTDETLVYLAVEHAVRTGQHTVILAADHDVEEQFTKMIELLTMHYWAMLIAREYIVDFARFDPRAVPLERAAATKLFTTATLLSLGQRRIHDFRPESIQFVSISCILIGEYVSHLVYGAETAMAEVLDVKARTGGRSTDLLGERDLHAHFVPEIPGERSDYAAVISTDVSEAIPGSSMSIANLDALMAINTKLAMSPVVPMSTSKRVLLRMPPRWAP